MGYQGLLFQGWRMVKSETLRDAEIIVRNPSQRLFGETFRDSKKVKANHEKTRPRDLLKTLPRFRETCQNFPRPTFFEVPFANPYSETSFFFFFQSDRPTQCQETHSTVNEEKKGDGQSSADIILWFLTKGGHSSVESNLPLWSTVHTGHFPSPSLSSYERKTFSRQPKRQTVAYNLVLTL